MYFKACQYFLLDYYNYYYGGYSENPEVADTQKSLSTTTAATAAEATTEETAECSTTETSAANEAAAVDAAEVCFY